MYLVPDTIKSELNFVSGQERKYTNSQQTHTHTHTHTHTATIATTHSNHGHDKTGILITITRADKINKYRLERDGKEDHYYYFSLSYRSCSICA